MGSQTMAAQFTRDGFGRTTNTVYSNGMLRTAAYDNLNRITQITGGGDFHEAISYDPLTGNITAITRENAQFTYSYDETDQLLASAYNGSVISPVLNRSFGYDLTGNRTNDTITGVSQILRNVLTENDEAIYYPESTGTGNLGQKTDKATGVVDAFSYRVDGKLTGYAKYAQGSSVPSIVAGYYFDALGRRIAKQVQVGAETISQSYLYQGDQDKILIGRAGNGAETLFIDAQGIDEHLGFVNAQTSKVFVTDHLGTVVNDDAVGPNKLTGAFGEATSAAPVISLASLPVRYGYTGRQLDEESGLNFFRNRMFDSHTGRFTAPDFMAFASGDNNHYRYVFNNSVLYNDPSGEILPLVLAILGGLLASNIANAPTSPADKVYKDESISAPVTGAAVGAATAVLATGDAAALGSAAFGKGGFLNSNQYLRVGVGRKGGDEVFRISGDLVPTESGHIDIMNLGPIKPKGGGSCPK